MLLPTMEQQLTGLRALAIAEFRNILHRSGVEVGMSPSAPSGSYQSKTISRRVREKRKLLTFAPWGPLAAVGLALLLVLDWMNKIPAHGIWVRLVPPVLKTTSAAVRPRAVIVRVSFIEKKAEYSIDGISFPSEQISMRLKEQLARQPEWVVYIDGAPQVDVRDVGIVINAANLLHAKVVLLTAKSQAMAAR